MLLAQAARESRIGDPIIFQRIDENEQILRTNSNGFMARFTVERMHANDNADFVNYLLTGNLCIEVWDADSLMHVGSSIIPLKGLLRQGADSIQSNLQCPIVESGFPIERTTTGLLFLRIANIGHPSNNQMDLFESRNKSAVITNRLVRLGRTNQIHQLRAQPLGAIHESALQRFLNTQKLDIRQRKEEIFGYDGLRRMKKWEEMKEKQTERLPKSTLKRFIFEEELEAYRTLRMEGKSAKLLKAVFRSITTHHIIYAKSGQVEFFEYVLRNTFAEPINCLIDVNNPCISVVTNTDEWKAFKDANKLKTSVERDLFHVESNGMKSVYLNALESLNIPFKFDLFARGPPLESTTEAYEIKIIFKRAETGEPIAILEVLIQSRGHTWDTSFRWFHEENARCSKLLKIQGIKGNQKVTAIRCTDPHVLCSIRNAPNGGQELLITCYAPESPLCREFLVLMYADRYFGTQLTSRGFALHGMQRLNVEAVQGQTTKIPLFLKPPNDPEMLIAFKSSTDCATVIPTEPIALTSSQPLNDLKLLILPTFSGKRTFLITAIEMKLRKLLNAWIVFVNVKEPTIAKTYEIEITNSTADIAKKIQFTNEYPVERNYRFYTSNEQIVSVENEYETVSANEQASIHLRFHPIEIDHPVYLDVLVFCEDAVNGQQEEAYGLRIKYTP
ncbi:Nephrocystin-4 [Aphelenchoides besseyi]|nr:Nephrocystin-4 [Aphelenchoides besseyi]